MDNALWVAKTGLEAQDEQMAVTANNISNAGTTGYKESTVQFSDLVYQNESDAGAESDRDTQNPNGIQIGTGVRVDGTEKDFSQGSAKITGRPLDVMIQGGGFLQVQLPDGSTAYTRNGALTKGPNGQLETQSGYPITPEIVIPDNASSVNIGKDGTVQVAVPEQAQMQDVGQITLAKFVSPTGLKSIGNNLYQATGASGTPIEDTPGNEGIGSLLQGSLEGSNVSVVNELVNMIQIQRTYEMNANAISTSSKMMEYTTTHIE